MMELTPIDRLKVYLNLHYPKCKMRHIRLLGEPGWIQIDKEAVDIRGVGYPPKTAILRLWKELHEHISFVDVQKEKNGQATRIEYQGAVYSLVPSLTYRKKKKREL